MKYEKFYRIVSFMIAVLFSESYIDNFFKGTK